MLFLDFSLILWHGTTQMLEKQAVKLNLSCGGLAMSQTRNPAQELLRLCQQVDAVTEQLIDTRIRELSGEVHQCQEQILEYVSIYREGLLKCASPTSDEFYDLFGFVTDTGQKFSCEVSLPYIEDGAYTDWSVRKSAPPLPARRYIMLAMLEQYLERDVLSGLGRLSQTVARACGGDLFSGDHRLPVRSVPKYVIFLEKVELWRIVDVTLPKHVNWYDRPSGTKIASQHGSYEVVQDLVGDLMMVDIILPAGCNPCASLHARLQKISGVGASKARLIIAWLEAIGCRVEKKVTGR